MISPGSDGMISLETFHVPKEVEKLFKISLTCHDLNDHDQMWEAAPDHSGEAFEDCNEKKHGRIGSEPTRTKEDPLMMLVELDRSPKL